MEQSANKSSVFANLQLQSFSLCPCQCSPRLLTFLGNGDCFEATIEISSRHCCPCDTVGQPLRGSSSMSSRPRPVLTLDTARMVSKRNISKSFPCGQYSQVVLTVVQTTYKILKTIYSVVVQLCMICYISNWSFLNLKWKLRYILHLKAC